MPTADSPTSSIAKEQTTLDRSVVCSIADGVQISRYEFWPWDRRAGRPSVGDFVRGRETRAQRVVRHDALNVNLRELAVLG